MTDDETDPGPSGLLPASQRTYNRYPGKVVIRRDDGLTQCIEVFPTTITGTEIGVLSESPNEAFGPCGDRIEMALEHGLSSGEHACDESDGDQRSLTWRYAAY